MEPIDFERLYPQGLLCSIEDVPEGCGSIYLITNLIDGKVYVEQTWQRIWKRWVSHKAEARKGKPGHLKNAMRFYKPENFSFGLLGYSDTQEGLDSLEELWIAVLGSVNPAVGYNERLGGRGGKVSEEGKKAMSKAHSSPETKAKLSAAAIAQWEDPEMRKHLTNCHISLWKNPEFLEKVKARRSSPEYRSKMKEIMTSPEMSARLSEASKNMWKDPAYREKRAASVVRIPKPPKNPLARSIAATKRWASPEYRKKQQITNESPESRLKRSQASKKREEKKRKEQQTQTTSRGKDDRLPSRL